MSEVLHQFKQKISYQGARSGKGELPLDARAVTFSVPASFGGLGQGTSPEELLLSAVGACYSLTLGMIASHIPAIERVGAEIDATVIEETKPQRKLFFKEIGITPQLYLKPGMAEPDGASLQRACARAKAACFITQTVTPGVGTVVLRDFILHRPG